jgi:hypothetical protein
MKRLFALAAVTLLGACASDDDSNTLPGWYPLPECPEHDLSACDTRNTECQAKLLSLAGCLYAVDELPRVPIRVVSEETLLEELDAGAQIDPEAEAVLPFAERALVQLKLAQPGDLMGGGNASLVERIDGVYMDAEQGISVVDRGAPKNDADANALLLHELLHAVQDAEYGLDEWREGFPGTEDAQLALRAVTEGQATFYQFRALLAMTGRDVDRIDWERSLDNFESDVLSEAYSDPSPYLASIVTFPYAYGARLAYRSWLAYGPRFHARQFAEPPLSTYRIVGDIEATTENFGELTFEEPIGAESSEHELVQSTALGAFLSELHLRSSGITAESAHVLAGQWRGDRLFLYSGPDGQAAWLWEVTLASAADGEAFIGHDFDAAVTAETVDGRVYLAGGDAGPPRFLLDAGQAFLQR